ncbi:MAG TPA: hypothetical protein PKI19_07395 [Elusimicrobiales bacterium]|nr:hypothetical protein [Elusimicrobiales bacterium]
MHGLAAAETPLAGQAIAQNRCFCVQLTKSFPVPYFLAKLDPPAPGCADAKYDGKPPLENGLLTCDGLTKCLNAGARYQKKKKTLDDKTAAARAALAACCPAAQSGTGAEAECDKDCGVKWEGVLKTLAAETEMLAKKEREAQDICFFKAKNKELFSFPSGKR